MKRKSAIVVFLVGLIPQIIALGWPTMPDIIQLFFRILSGIAVIILIVLLVIVIRDWRKAKNDVQMKQGEHISMEPYVILVEDIKGNNDQMEITLFQAKVRSWLLKPLIIKGITAKLELPISKGQWTDQIVSFSSDSMTKWELSGDATRGSTIDVSLLCERNSRIPKSMPLEKHFQVKGKAMITTDLFPEIRVDFETTVYLYKIESGEDDA